MSGVPPESSETMVEHPDKITLFKDLQADERYRSKQRMMKLANLKKPKDPNRAPSWSLSSISSIYNSDTSYVASSLNASKVGSDIVSSSSNLRNKLLKKAKTSRESGLMLSSSTPLIPVERNIDDAIAMPPPRSTRVRYCSDPKTPGGTTLAAVNSLLNTDHTTNATLNKYDNRIDNTNCTYSKSCPDDSVMQETESLMSKSLTSDVHKPNSRVFSKWKVKLNATGQLLIKGTLEGGKTARSKPVMRRLAADCVESVFKHKYYLHGNIFDYNNELPEYVFGKFYNGFPEDWKNVHEIWKSYITGGSRRNFRWPTQIADSDDDLRSEITEYTVIDGRRKNPVIVESNSFSTVSTGAFDESRLNRSAKKTRIISDYESSGADEEVTDRSKIKEQNGSHSGIISDKRNNETRSSKVDCNTSLSSKFTDFIREDKLKAIMDNLADKNCPREYFDKFINVIDCLNYVAGNTPSKTNETNEIEARITRSGKSRRKIGACGEPGRGASIDRRLTRSTKGASKPHYNSVSSDDSDPVPLQQDTSTNKPYDILNGSSKAKRGRRQNYSISSSELESEIDERSNVSRRTDELNSRRSVKVSRGTTSFVQEGGPKLNTERLPSPQESLTGLPPSRIQRTANPTILCKPKSVETVVSSDARVEHEQPYRKMSTEKERRNLVSRTKYTDVSSSEDEMVRQPKLSKEDIGKVPHRKSHRNLRKKHLQRNRPHKLCLDSSDSEMEIYAENTVSNRSKIPSPKKTLHTIGGDTEASTSRSNLRTVDTQCLLNVSHQRKNTRTIHNGDRLLLGALQDAYVSPWDADIEYSKKPQIRKVEKIKAGANSYHLRSSQSNISILENAKGETNDIQKVEAEQSIRKSPSKRLGNRRNTSDPYPGPDSDKENHILKARLDSTSPNKVLRSSMKEKEAYGTESNPKLLAAWTPVIGFHDSTNRLAFRGNLLNELGHVDKRRFETNWVDKRISARLLKTTCNTYYKLTGEMNNANHVVPNELVPRCRDGCPRTMNDFCKEWRKLETTEAIKEVRCETSVENLSIPTSSRGRRIIPRLNYWDGQSVVLKDCQTMYCPGKPPLEQHRNSSLDSTKRSNTSQNEFVNKSSTSTKTEATKSFERLGSNANDNSYSPSINTRSKSDRRNARTLDFSSGEEETNNRVPTTKKRKGRASENTQDAERRNVFGSDVDKTKKWKAPTEVHPIATRSSQYEAGVSHGRRDIGGKRRRMDIASALGKSSHNFPSVNSTPHPPSSTRKKATTTWEYHVGVAPPENILSDVPNMMD